MSQPTAIQSPATKEMYTQLGIAEAVKRGNLIYVSGQVGWDATQTPAEGFAAQARLALTNMKGILEQAGASGDDIIEMKAFIVKPAGDASLMDLVGQLFEMKKEVFPTNVCAATAVGINELVFAELQVEIAAVAYVD